MNSLAPIIARTTLWACLAMGVNFISAQQVQPPPLMQQPIGQRVGGMLNDYANAPSQAEKMAHWSNEARQKKLLKDSATLVDLTAQFKQRMATRGNRNLNDDDLRLIARIEKLAHSIREGMAFAGQAPPPPTTNRVFIW